MKFVGLFKKEFKILEDVDPSRLSSLKADFAWIDIDRLDPKTELALSELYGIELPKELGFPNIFIGENYTLLLLNYYEDLTKKELQVIAMDKCLITVHQGSDTVCDANMASVNETLVSGDFNAGTILRGLFTAIVERHAEHLSAMRVVLRTVEAQLKQGIKNITPLLQLETDAAETHRVFYGTRTQISDIVLGVTTVRGVSKPEILTGLYASVNTLCRGADDLAEIFDEYESHLLPFILAKIDKTKKIAVGVSVFSVSIAAAALLYAIFRDGLPWLPNANMLHIVLGVVALGFVGLLAAQRSIKFKIS